MNNKMIILRNFLSSPSAVLGFLIIFSLVFAAIFADVITQYDPIKQDLDNTMVPPMFAEGGSFAHILGTDDFGRDTFSRIIHGARISIFISLIAVSISMIGGVFIGVTAGYIGKTYDAIVMRLMDVLQSIPSILLAIVIVAILGPSLYNAMIAIGIVGIPLYARISRGSVLSEAQKEYVVASRLSGSSNSRLMFKIILPNCLSPIVVQATMGLGSALLDAAGLSFLGLGAQPPMPEWGAMLSDSIKYITTAPWLMVFPGLSIFSIVLGFNLLGDGLMEALDPKLLLKGK